RRHLPIAHLEVGHLRTRRMDRRRHRRHPPRRMVRASRLPAQCRRRGDQRRLGWCRQPRRRTHRGCLMAAPTTGFEDTAGAAWTTRAEQEAFLNAIAADPDANGRMTMEVLGLSTIDARPVRAVYLGIPAPANLAAVPTGKCILFLGSQHGSEP